MPEYSCPICGRTFFRHANASKLVKYARLCSRACQSDWRKGRFTGDDHAVARRNATFAFTDEQWQIIYGSILGDGSLSKPKTGNHYHLAIAHSVRQLDYLRWKHDALLPLASEPSAYRRLDPRYGHTYETWRFHTPSMPRLTALHAECYPESKKCLPVSLLERCGPLALAIWFMDDGSQYGGVPRLATIAFSPEDVERACQWFADRWGIIGRRNKSNRIVFLGPTRETLRDMIEPYILPSMSYKLPGRWMLGAA